MTNKIELLNQKASSWARLTDWLGAIDSSLDLDPAQNSLNETIRKIERLETRVSNLEVAASGNEN